MLPSTFKRMHTVSRHSLALQVFMRRAPPPWAASAAARAATGDLITRPLLMEHAVSQLEELLEDGARLLLPSGFLTRCNAHCGCMSC